MASRIYYDELADFLSGMADEISLDKKDPDIFEPKTATVLPTTVLPYKLAMKATTVSYNLGLDRASEILRDRANKLREQ